MLRHQKPIEDTSPGHCHILVIYFVFCLRERRFQRLFDATLDRWKLTQLTHSPRPSFLSHPHYLAQLFVLPHCLVFLKLIPITSPNSPVIPIISPGFHRIPTTHLCSNSIFFFPSIFAHVLLPPCIWHQSPLPHPYLLPNPSYLTQIIVISFVLPRAYQTPSLCANSYLVTSLYFTSIPTTSPISLTTSQLPHSDFRNHFYYLALSKLNRSVRTHISLPHFILHQSPLPHLYFHLHACYRTQMINFVSITSCLETIIHE